MHLRFVQFTVLLDLKKKKSEKTKTGRQCGQGSPFEDAERVSTGSRIPSGFATPSRSPGATKPSPVKNLPEDSTTQLLCRWHPTTPWLLPIFLFLILPHLSVNKGELHATRLKAATGTFCEGESPSLLFFF